jgi:hypothetical protein
MPVTRSPPKPEGPEALEAWLHDAIARTGTAPETRTFVVDGIPISVTLNGEPSYNTPAERELEQRGRRYYVYAHRDAGGKIFYVGKGTGDRAWSTDRHGLWHRYVRERSGGRYTVEILKGDLTECEAESLEGRIIAEHGASLVNWDNPSRGDDLEALSQYHARREANEALASRAKELERTDPQQAIGLYLHALEELRGYESMTLMRGSLVAELLAKEPKSFSPEILDRLTLCLVRCGEAERARALAAAFFADFPATATTAKGQAISKRLAPRPESSTPRTKRSE